jgi:2-haloacid dehalogenase
VTGAPTVVVFDVNETLSDLRPLAQRFTDLGAPAHLARLWFAVLLRDAFALTAAGALRRFADLAVDAVHTVLAGVEVDRSPEDAAAHVVDGFAQLSLHPDVAEGVRALRQAGLRLVTLSNGAASVAERLLGDAGIRDQFEAVLSVEDAGAWKPARRAYEHAARTCGTEPERMLMVAVHPWDVDGAQRAGMRGAWIDRDGGHYPAVLTPPAVTARDLPDLARRLTSS